MKKFKTMSELDIMYAANETFLGRWSRERERVEKDPDNKIAKHRMEMYWERLEELTPEICRLEKKADKN